MRYYGIAVLIRIALAVLALPAAASAQAVARTFDELNVRVRSGETVYVTDNQSRTIDGLLLTVSADALVMEAASGRVTLSVAQVDRVRVRRRDSLKNGILEGLAAGAAGGALAALLTDGHDRPSTQCMLFCGGFFSTGQAIAAGMLVGGVLGIGAGAAIDAVIKERRPVLRKGSLTSELADELQVAVVAAFRVAALAFPRRGLTLQSAFGPIKATTMRFGHRSHRWETNKFRAFTPAATVS